jgi:hypothetical protein
MSKVKVTRSNLLPSNILVNTLVSTSFNGFWPNLVHTLQSLEPYWFSRSKVKIRGSNFYLVNIRMNILQWILLKLGKYLCPSENLKPYWFSRSKVKVTGSTFLPRNILVNTRINILQWILIKLGTYLVLRRVWNILIFKVICQRSRSHGLIFTLWAL